MPKEAESADISKSKENGHIEAFPVVIDDCLLARRAHFTGDILSHELAWAGEELWLVDTLFPCLCTLHSDYSFVPRWWLPFVTTPVPKDRCHLIGRALTEARPT